MRLFEESHKEIKKEAGVKLPQEMGKWTTAIQAEILNQYPFLNKYYQEVHINQADENRGVGVGRVVVMSRPKQVQDDTAVPPGKMVYIPFIISDWVLKDMDVFVASGESFQPLTPRRVEEALVDYENIYQPAPKEEADMQDGQFISPLSALPPATPEYFMGKMGSVDPKILIRGKAALSWLPNDLREKIASIEAEELVSNRRMLSVQLTPTRDSVFVRMLMDSGEVIEKKASYPATMKAFGEVPKKRKTISLVEPAEGEKTAACEPKVIANYPEWGTAELEGNLVDGHVFPDIIKLSGDLDGRSLFISRYGDYAYLDAPLIRKTASAPVSLPSGEFMGRGVFMINGTPTEPVTVLNVSVERGQEKYAALAGLDGRKILTRGPVKMPQKIAQGEFMLPNSARFIPLKGLKIATSDVRPVDDPELISDGSQFSLRGVQHGTQIDSDGMAASDAALLLAGLGVGDADSAVKKAAIRGSIRAPMYWEGSEKVASAPSKTILDMWPELDFIKEALEIEDTMTVDRALSLHFLTPERLTAIAGAIPQYEHAVRKLSELLISSQLGLSPDALQSSVVRTAMRAIDAVIERLRLLRGE